MYKLVTEVTLYTEYGDVCGIDDFGRIIVGVVIFFFKQKTAYEIYQCDWSSDVCSSDLKIRNHPAWFP